MSQQIGDRRKRGKTNKQILTLERHLRDQAVLSGGRNTPESAVRGCGGGGGGGCSRKRKINRGRNLREMELTYKLYSDFCIRQTVFEMKADGLFCLSVVCFFFLVRCIPVVGLV